MPGAAGDWHFGRSHPRRVRRVRRLLADRQTWVRLRTGPVEDLATWIAGLLPPRDGRTADDSHAAALVITRGLLEFTAADLDPKTFNKVLLARLSRMETGQASTLDKALLDFHSGLAAGLDPDRPAISSRRATWRMPGPVSRPGSSTSRRAARMSSPKARGVSAGDSRSGWPPLWWPACP